jgi:hypothetical protein
MTYILYRAKARIIQHKAEQEIPIPSLRKSRKELHDRLKVKWMAHVSEILYQSKMCPTTIL